MPVPATSPQEQLSRPISLERTSSSPGFAPLRRPTMQHSATSFNIGEGRRRPSLDADPFANAKCAQEASLIFRHGISPRAASYLSGERLPSSPIQRAPKAPTSPQLGDFMMESEADFDYFSAAISNASSESSGSCLPTPDEPVGRQHRWSTGITQAFDTPGRLSLSLAGLTIAEGSVGTETYSPLSPSQLSGQKDQGTDAAEPREGHRRSMSRTSRLASNRALSPQKHKSRKAALLHAAQQEEAFDGFSDAEDYRER